MEKHTKGDNFVVSKNYENSLDTLKKQEKGIYYTPREIVDYILENTLKKHDIIDNPCPKVLDISCGCGNFLLKAYDVLYELIENNIEKLNELYGDKFILENIHSHILSNCIYGYDIDKDAIDILIESLNKKSDSILVKNLNIYCTDSLKHNFNEKFDYIIGNPPYIGHKKLDKEYKKFLLKEYKNTYRDKSDLYFCFYEKCINLLEKGGICSLITPRYFIESPSGKHLRKYISKHTYIKEIIDFLGVSVFKNIGICSCILTLVKDLNKNSKIDILKPVNENMQIEDLRYLLKNNKFEKFYIDQENLDENWIILNENDKKLYNKIQNNCNYTLEDIVTSFQGIITGCDKAFVLDIKDEKINKVDKKLLRNWIKNKNINKYTISSSNYKLIYSDDIKDENDYKLEIGEIIGKYKDKLCKRRECVNNTRKWYKLQWGRDKNLFEQIKIMYPYKSSQNKFAIDYNNSFCSADVYSFFIKEEYKKEFSEEYIVGILNSNIYDRYYKINAKKISKNIYDYYPNKVMKIKIFKDDNYHKIENLSKLIIHNINNNKEIDSLQLEIDNLIKDSLDIKSLM